MSGVLGTIMLRSCGAVAINAVKVRHGTARKVGIDWVDLDRVWISYSVMIYLVDRVGRIWWNGVFNVSPGKLCESWGKRFSLFGTRWDMQE